MSSYRNVLLPKCLLPKHPLPKCPLPKCLDTVCNMLLSTVRSFENIAKFHLPLWAGLGSVKNELELFNSIPELERELELKDLEQNGLNWN